MFISTEAGQQELVSRLSTVASWANRSSLEPLMIQGPLRERRGQIIYRHVVHFSATHSLSALWTQMKTLTILEAPFCKVVFSYLPVPSFWPYHHIHNKKGRSDFLIFISLRGFLLSFGFHNLYHQRITANILIPSGDKSKVPTSMDGITCTPWGRHTSCAFSNQSLSMAHQSWSWVPFGGELCIRKIIFIITKFNFS